MADAHRDWLLARHANVLEGDVANIAATAYAGFDVDSALAA